MKFIDPRFAAFFLFLAGAGWGPAETASTKVPRTIPDFNVMTNDDGDWLCTSPDPVESERNLRLAVDSLAGTAVKTLVQCAAIGSDVMYFPTKAGSNIGWREATPSAHLDNAKAFIDSGRDPIRVVGEQAKADGLYFMPSYRMNDQHFASDPDAKPLTGEFWMQNRDRFTMKNRRLDFSYPEVRQYRMGIILEIIDRYQDIMDGLELDFSRGGSFFPDTEAREKAPLLTEMVAQVRACLAELERKNGRTYTLAVRVWPAMHNSKFSGMDVDDWMRHGLVDIVIPTQLYTTAYDMPIPDYVSIARETKCKVYPCIYERTQFNWPFLEKPTAADYAVPATYRPSAELIAGAASNYRAMGADGFEMFNFRVPIGPLGLVTQRLLSSPAALTGRNRVYAITQAGGSDAKADTYQYIKQIPLELGPGMPADLKLYIGEDFSVPKAIPPSYVGLRLGLRDADPNQHVRISINGEMIYQGAMAPNLLPATGPAEISKGFPHVPQAFFQVALSQTKFLKKGENTIRVEAMDGGTKFNIIEVQVGVLFADAYSKKI